MRFTIFIILVICQHISGFSSSFKTSRWFGGVIIKPSQINLSVTSLKDNDMSATGSELSENIVEDNDSDMDVDQIIVLTEAAKNHFKKLPQKGDFLYVRMGVRAGGCNGMSYIMDVIDGKEVEKDDHIEEYDEVKCVIDPKSLLYIYGMQLDYSDELIGGGFQFSNPNAETSW